MENLRKRYLRDLTASTAFFTMMLFEEHGQRRDTLRYLWEAVRGKERTWRGSVTSKPRVVSRLSSAAALVLGPFKYIQGVLADS
jgi:hypothetical protein